MAMRQLYLNRAIAEGVMREMERDENVFLMGEDIINKGGGLSIFMGVHEQYPKRAADMPIAELGFSDMAVGMAALGMRPIVDLMFSDFVTLPFDAIVNGAAKLRYCTLGETAFPLVFVLGNGGRGTYDGVGSGCHHSQSVEAWFMNVPGLKVVLPYYPSDALGLMRASIRDNDPVVFLYHLGSLGVREEVTDEDYIIPLNNAAKIMQEGNDITIVALQSMVPVALNAVGELKEKGINAELIDPRVLIPLDIDKIAASVQKTKKLLIVQEAPSRGGPGSEIIAQVMYRCANTVNTVRTIGALNMPIPSGFAEALMMPHVSDITKAAMEMCGK